MFSYVICIFTAGPKSKTKLTCKTVFEIPPPPKVRPDDVMCFSIWHPVVRNIAGAFCIFHVLNIISQISFFCLPQHLQTTYRWWQRTRRLHSVDIKPRISLSSALQKEGNQPRRWVVAEDAPRCPQGTCLSYTVVYRSKEEKRLRCVLLPGFFPFSFLFSRYQRTDHFQEKRRFKQDFKRC